MAFRTKGRKKFKSKLSIVVFEVKYVGIEVENAINEVRKKDNPCRKYDNQISRFCFIAVERKLSAIV